MKKGIILLILLSAALSTVSADVMEVRRFGLFIGANNGGDTRQKLLYAGDDATAMSNTMRDIGGIDPPDNILLIDPDSNEILEKLREMSREINRVETLVRRTEVMFYYSGHSDENGILLSDNQIRYKTIRDMLEASGADVVIAVLDSCSSGAFTRTKGGQRRSPFLIDESSTMEGHAFLTSSSETELSQESDRIGASFFTHYLITGLRGAADNTRDGRVTLNEVYQHTYQETLSKTESTIGGPQHPAYEIQLTGTGDLVLTDLTVPTSALQLSGELAGRFSVRNRQDRLVAEFTKPEGDTLKLALPSGAYTIRLDDDLETYGNSDDVKTARIELSRNAQLYLTKRDFSSNGLEFTRFRGNLKQGDKDEKYVFALLPGLNYPSLNADDLVRIQAGLLGSIAPQLSGIQASWIFNITGQESEGIQASEIFNLAEDDFQGIQASGVFNITEGQMEGLQASGVFNISDSSMSGIQSSGVFNIAGDYFSGVQTAGLFNIVDRPATGIQAAGLFNIAGELKGIQAASLFNYGSYMHGLQASLLNVTGTMRGLQIGLLNINREVYGLPIGFVSLSRNGIVDTGVWYEYEDDHRVYTSFQSGTNYFYTLYYFGNKQKDYLESQEDMVWGFHLGSRISFGPFDIDLDGGAKQCYKDLSEDHNFSVPSARVIIALKGFGLFWGVTMDIQYPGATSALYTGEKFSFLGNRDYPAYYRYVFGFRI